MKDSNEEKGEKQQLEQETRFKVLAARRTLIRSVLKSAESVRNYQLQQQQQEKEEEESGRGAATDSSSKKNKTKFALSLTAFLVAAGAILLRVGGRAALVSTLGLDFAQDNPELKETLDKCLAYTDSMDSATKFALFLLAWTLVKVFCFDSGGVVLALISGILFGGVLQGATMSAFAATVGSTVAFYLAQASTPFRTKALELLDENPALRGVQKVVSEDGFKSILTLRLAPILPIPLGMYNYIYGLTNVTLPNFAAGIFLGSFKPYLLDSYLGYFGKELVEGEFVTPASTSNPTAIDTTAMIPTMTDAATNAITTSTTNALPLSPMSAADIQDFILLLALGASVLIGTFASQLAGDTWDSIQKEIQTDKDAKRVASITERGLNYTSTYDEDAIMRKFMGFEFPDWVVGMLIAYQEANQRISTMIQTEYSAKVWNYTTTSASTIPSNIDPAKHIDSPENSIDPQGFDFVPSFMDGIALSPSLIQAFFKYSDPQYNETLDSDIIFTTYNTKSNFTLDVKNAESNMVPLTNILSPTDSPIMSNYASTQDELIESWRNILTRLRHKVEARLDALNQNATTQYLRQK